MTISIVNEKGGSGKTTLSVNLSAMLADDGDNVLLIDSDPQKSTAVFSDMRSQAELEPLFSNFSKVGMGLSKEIARIKNNYDSIIIDTGGRDSIEMRQAMIFSDIIIIPSIPSQYDISVLDHMLFLHNQTKINNSKLLALILPNRVSPNPFLAKELQNLRDYIETSKQKNGFDDIKVMESVIYERQAYRRAVEEGKSIKEFCKSDDKALLDFKKFYDELLQIAQNHFR